MKYTIIKKMILVIQNDVMSWNKFTSHIDRRLVSTIWLIYESIA